MSALIEKVEVKLKLYSFITLEVISYEKSE